MFLKELVTVSLLFYAAGVGAFSVTTKQKNMQVEENKGVDLTCTHSADFGKDARIEWKFKNTKDTQAYVYFDGKPTVPYAGRVTVFGGNLRFDRVTRKDTGQYDCEVSGNEQFGEARITLTVLVAPSPPRCTIPTSATTGRKVVLSCVEPEASPPPTYKWYKNGTLLPSDPNQFPQFKNAKYAINSTNGSLVFSAVAKNDTGSYYCEAANSAGPAQRCNPVKMTVRDINTGGIVAGVIVALLALALLGFGLWYANKKGYLPKKSESKPRPSAVYQPTTLYGGAEDEDGEFRQKSSFVV